MNKTELPFFNIGSSYGRAHWLRFDRFWETGMEERGGLIIVKEMHQ